MAGDVARRLCLFEGEVPRLDGALKGARLGRLVVVPEPPPLDDAAAARGRPLLDLRRRAVASQQLLQTGQRRLAPLRRPQQLALDLARVAPREPRDRDDAPV